MNAAEESIKENWNSIWKRIMMVIFWYEYCLWGIGCRGQRSSNFFTSRTFLWKKNAFEEGLFEHVNGMGSATNKQFQRKVNSTLTHTYRNKPEQRNCGPLGCLRYDGDGDTNDSSKFVRRSTVAALSESGALQSRRTGPICHPIGGNQHDHFRRGLMFRFCVLYGQ